MISHPTGPSWGCWKGVVAYGLSSGVKQTQERPGSLLYYAGLFGLVDTIKFLQTQRDFDLSDLSGKYGMRGNLSTVRFLIHTGADVNIQGGEYDRAIFAAINSGDGHFEIAELFLDKGADLAVVDQGGNTPLMDAIRCGHIEVAKTPVGQRLKSIYFKSRGSFAFKPCVLLGSH